MALSCSCALIGARPALVRLNLTPQSPTAIQLFHSPLKSLSLSSDQKIFLSSCRRFCLVPYAKGKAEDHEEEDGRTLHSHWKSLYHVLRKKSILRLPNVIYKGCNNICDSQGKKKVLELFISLVTYLQSHMELLIQPTPDGRVNVGVQWHLAWEKSHEPLGKGYSFYTSHLYQGKMIIRDVQILLGPILLIAEPLRRKVVGFLMHVVDKFVLKGDNKRAKETVYYCLSLFTFAMFFILLENTF